MINTFPNERRPVSGLFILLGFGLVGMAIGNIVAALVMIAMTNIGVQDIESLNTAIIHTPNGWWAMIIGQGLASAIMFILAGWAYWRWIEKRRLADLNFRPLPPLRVFLLTFALQLSAAPLMGLVQKLNEKMKLPASLSGIERAMRNMEDSLGETLKFLTDYSSPAQFLLVVLVVAIIAGIGEELLFRGLLQRKLYQLFGSAHVAIWVAAAIFSAIHFQFYGFFPRLLLGVLFGYLYYFTGNIWVPIAAHIFNNAFAVVVLNLIKNKQLDPSYEKMDNLPLPVVVVSAILVFGLFYLIRTNFQRVSHQDLPPTS